MNTNMKKIAILFILTGLFLTGCELDRLPETDFTDQAYWKSETDLKGACNRLYYDLKGFSHDLRSDELISSSPNNVSNGSRSTPTTDNDNWRDPYRWIYVANNILDKSLEANVTEAVLNRWLAEARFFRAYHYFELTKKFGGVPLVLKSFDTTDDPEITKGRNSREEVIAQCYEDLDFAIQWLPAHFSLPASDWGRVTRSSALALKARIGLYNGTITKYHNLDGDYMGHLQKAISASEAVMNEGHALYPDFQELFYFEGEGAQNKENIFVKVYGPNGAGTTNHGNSRGLENSAALSRQMIDLFLYEDGLPRSKSSLKPETEASFNTALEKRDPRMKLTVYSLDEEAYKGGYVPFTNQHGQGYPIKKGFMISQWELSGKETVDKMLIRYAEVLISYAEALYEYNGSITDEQLDKTVNALRSRVGFEVKLTNAFATQNGLNILDEIRRERTIEFLDEGLRYDDIIRWKIAEEVLPVDMVGIKFVDSETSRNREDIANRLLDANGMLNGKKIHDQADLYVIELADSRRFNPAKDYLYPIPVNEIGLTEGNITQNPGW